MERARVPGDLIQGSGLVNDANREEGLVNGSGSARASDEASCYDCACLNLTALSTVTYILWL
jgi:hypothetical protein